jgi:hypothetical protein
MSKIYKFLLFFLILLLLILNLIFFSYDKKFMAQFEDDTEVKSSKDIILSLDEEDYFSDFLDTDMLEDERFKELKDFQVDLEDFDSVDDLISSESGGEGEDEDEEDPEVRDLDFETGNPNPFLPQF